MKKFKIEQKVIDPILNLIKKNQGYLTQRENLPQLAKLGYIYNTLWTFGRLVWGNNGLLTKKFNTGQCEDNPKYKIEMCKPKTEEIENLIYDAWGLHVENDLCISWKEFSKTVFEKTILSEKEVKMLKLEKTCDDWLEIYSLEESCFYKELFPNRNRILDHLFFVIGNGYDCDGKFIYESGVTKTINLAWYGDWRNVKFRKDIEELVEEVLDYPEVKLTLETSYSFIKHEQLTEEIKRWGVSKDDFDRIYNFKSMFNYSDTPYYPVSERFSNITFFNEGTHPSYLKYGLEVCQDILNRGATERKENLKFAEEFILRFKNINFDSTFN